jgi:hypothetical protein
MKRLVLLVLMVETTVLGSSPQTWELSQYADFLKGKLSGVSVTREGVLEPGPVIGQTLALADVSLWSMAQARDGSVYLGTGPKGRIYRRALGAKDLTLVATLNEAHVFALAIAPDQTVYAAGSPGGKIYRLTPGGAQLYADTGAGFVWGLLATGDGLYAGADQGRLYRVTAAGAQVHYQSDQANLTSLARAADGAILAGSDPNGILYRIPAAGKAEILYDAPFTEIRSVIARADGTVAFLAMGGAVGKRSQTVNQPAGTPATGLPQVTTTITVTEEAQGGLDLKPKATPPAAATPAPAASATAVSSTLDVPGLDRSAIYRLNADRTVDQLYVTKEESLYDLADGEGVLYFSTDRQGRLYRLEDNRSATLLSETGEGELGRILPQGKQWLAISTTTPKLLVIEAAARGPFTYEAPVHEAANLARWGALQTQLTGQALFETRSGNAARPDATWSEWQPLAGGNIQSPTARYIQWRLRAEASFRLRSAIVHYLPRNQPPVVRSLTAVVAMTPSNAPKPQAAAATSSTYTLTVSDTGEASSSTAAATASLLATRPAGRQLLLSWTAEDPDGDTLQYSLHFRAEEENDWKLLKAELTDVSHAIDADTLADGRYLFRLTASDGLSNSTAAAQTAVFTSVPVQLDQTAPSVELTLNGARLEMEARDTASPIRRIEYAVNAGRWVVVEAGDGLFDSLRESARADLALGPGESLITVRVFDAALNVALRKLLVRR